MPCDPTLVGEAAIARNTNGTLEVLGTDGIGDVWHRTETAPGSNLWSAWDALDSKTLRHIGAETNALGQVEVIGVDQDGNIWQTQQTSANGTSYAPWRQIDGQFRP
jgi:hypothetical protein